MKKYKINRIKDFSWYTLEDEIGQEYEIGITFYDIEPIPQKDEYIYLSEKLFDIKANEGLRYFSFGGLSEIYGRNITEKEIESANAFLDYPDSYSGMISEELLIIERINERIVLKRFYG